MTPEKNGFGWDDQIDPKDTERPDLPDGPATFAVVKIQRDRKEFGKYGVQNIAKLTLSVMSMVEGAPEPAVEFDVNLALINDLKWKVLQFFTAIGQRKHGDAGNFAPNWAKVEGEIGRCVLQHREFKKKDGTTAKALDVKEFLAPEEAKGDDNLKF